MKIQCDVCEKGSATIICCADEAALCAKCDIEVHQANKLASKHQRLFLDSLSNKLPKCDICQDKTAFIFCVEDRALFCRDCDDSVHSVGTLSSNHQRLLATGIRVSLTSNCCANGTEKHCPEPPNNQNLQPFATKVPSPQPSSVFANSSSWGVDDLLQLSDFQSGDKKETTEFGELEWFTGIGLFNNERPREPMAAAEVPQLHISSSSQQFNFHPTTFNRSIKPYSNTPNKRPRIEISNDDEDNLFTVPDLG